MEIKKLNKLTKIYYLNSNINTIKITGIKSGYTKFKCEIQGNVYLIDKTIESPLIEIYSTLFDSGEVNLLPKTKGFVYNADTSIAGYDCFFEKVKIYQNIYSDINGEYNFKISLSGGLDYDFFIQLLITFDC